ncbi:hypothetical protein HanRHA438_Chr11g0509301 [Helianthus annuus]|uniref:DUF7866 domain-containing protein n=1 Tax=Helianthus annuus TaxID=4232 RepID=A0A251T9B0_HELAN|nr:hypothetical protein HanXRQr2_Chr11g0496711 [Helianthus annuus]KAJ0501991.1 hypothetical protein HanHA300_Chr11g0407451 [Helianthus annuus]KAJ0685934.1 hypothetical protein HanLR1_Chr11g0408681 [Helianthus annuus]KAJ0689798.1 hypothetical protein HanOQP8_Chr11g0410201 [Helianthus annuus]KAJ0871186.1 hypothetical protein HanRHA438_Chr11g0509301 [Helianthus annuus]
MFYIHNIHASCVTGVNMSEDVMPLPVPVQVPLGRSELYAMLAGRRRLSPFQTCSTCKCCLVPSDPTTCSDMPCCYKINCNIPNKPFGTCAFVPTSCNCNNCASS